MYAQVRWLHGELGSLLGAGLCTEELHACGNALLDILQGLIMRASWDKAIRSPILARRMLRVLTYADVC
jgi:hypothetical protein